MLVNALLLVDWALGGARDRDSKDGLFVRRVGSTALTLVFLPIDREHHAALALRINVDSDRRISIVFDL